MAFRRSGRDFDLEIEAHIAIEAERLIAEGVEPEQASQQARRAFGNVTRAQEHYHERRHPRWLADLRRDLLTAARNVRRAPVSSLIVVLSLAGGIGAATAALVVRNALFHNPPPLYRAPELLSRVQANPVDRPIMPMGAQVPASLFARWMREPGRQIAGAIDARPGDLRRPGGVDSLPIRAVTPNLFAVLGVQAAAGRLFDPAGASGLAGEVVLSHGVWQRSFGSRADVAGTRVSINGVPLTVVGVLPERFWYRAMADEVWVAVDPRLIPADVTLHVVVRRPDNVSAAELQATLQRVVDTHNRARATDADALHIQVSGVGGTPLGAMMSLAMPFVIGLAVVLVLLIGCANAAILLIAQWTSRETETAVRSSLGASRVRLVRALLTEALLLSMTAGICGVVATYVIRWWVLGQSGADFAKFDVSLPPLVLAQSLVLAIGAGIAAGLAPALYETARLQMNPLRGLQASDRQRQRWTQTLVVAEISITVALLVVTTTMLTAYQRTRDAQFGFGMERLAVAAIGNAGGLPVRPLVDRVGSIRGVRAAAVTTNAPIYGGRVRQAVSVEPGGATEIPAERNAVTPGFFDVIGVTLRAGRTFTAEEHPDSGVTIVNETLARRLFGTTAALGRQVWIERMPHSIVGVVADYAASWQEYQGVAPKHFVPLAGQPRDARLLFVLARTDGSPTPLVDELPRAVRDISPDHKVSDAYTYGQMAAVIDREWMVMLAPLAPLITIGIVLTAAGIYGVLAFAIARQTRDFAIRTALGATAANQVGLVTLRSLRLLIIGNVLGVGFTFALSRVARAAGGAGSIYDPPWSAFVLPMLVIAVVGALATLLPSFRARRTDPARLLRST